MDEQLFIVSEVAEKIQRSKATVRTYADDEVLQQILSKHVADGKIRQFTEDDVQIIYSASEIKSKRRSTSMDEIVDFLRDRSNWYDLPPIPKPISGTTFEIISETQITAMEHEITHLKAQIEDYRQQLADAYKKIGRLEAEIEQMRGES